jgi:predicted transcriptional regulator of viral defense system
MLEAGNRRKEKRSSLLRSSQVHEPKSDKTRLMRLQKRGVIERVSKGVWRDLRVETSLFHSFVEPAFRSPQGVICLLSALSFHNLTTQQPAQVWFAIGQDAKPPKTAEINLRVVRMSEVCLSEGIEVQTIEGVPVRITTVARTVADCFKFRNKVGLDVAIEALRDCLKKRLATVTEIHRYAQICRVGKIMQPYLETILELI